MANEMPNMPEVDESSESKDEPKRRAKGSPRVRAGPSIRGAKTKRKPGWPFLHYEENGAIYYNPARKLKQPEPEYEPAPF